MKKIFTLFLLFSFHLSKAQHYTQGVVFDTTLYQNGFYTSNGCTSTDATISLDPALYNYVNGMQFMIIMDTVYFAGPVGASPYHAGDTIILDSMNPSFHTVTGAASFWFRIKLVGTPALASQNYPCNLAVNLCTCSCMNMFVAPVPGSPTCTVDLSNQVPEIKKTESLSVFPNPVANSLFVAGIAGKTDLRLYDTLGKLVIEQETDNDSYLNTADLTEGMYTLSVDDGKHKTFSKVLVAR